MRAVSTWLWKTSSTSPGVTSYTPRTKSRSQSPERPIVS